MKIMRSCNQHGLAKSALDERGRFGKADRVRQLFLCRVKALFIRIRNTGYFNFRHFSGEIVFNMSSAHIADADDSQTHFFTHCKASVSDIENSRKQPHKYKESIAPSLSYGKHNGAFLSKFNFVFMH